MRTRQTLFASHYADEPNATKAAIAAGYSKRTARQMGSENLSKPDILEKIEEFRRARACANELSAEVMIDRLIAEVNADMADIFDVRGRILHPNEWPEVWRRGLVQNFTFRQTMDAREGYRISLVKIRFADRLPRLTLLGRHCGAW